MVRENISRAVNEEFIKTICESFHQHNLQERTFSMGKMEPANLEIEKLPNLMSIRMLRAKRRNNSGSTCGNRIEGVNVFEKRGRMGRRIREQLQRVWGEK
ncbi:unnamed protein product [Cuscuta epithymum]|uniref:Uncharacterized protein n=1 Tax=Cuscuta epithymum TaxID=186058 RepID=A0AAV0G8F2_9ASTE|nr:unnamed protein product [Cuscuta epithymum]